MATYNSAGSGNFNADATWTESGQPSTDDVAVIASGHTVTMTADDAVGSIDIQGTLTTDGTARTLTLDDGGQGYICENRGTVSTTINLTINSNYAGDRLIRLNNGGNGNFNNVSITLESTSRKLTIGTEAASIDGDLTITQGEFNTDSSNNYALTVTEQCFVNGGTLTLNGSTVDVGDVKLSSGTINGNTATIDINQGTGGGWAFQQTGGTWNYNTSTVVQKANDKHINVDFYNLKIEVGTNNSTVWRDQSGNTMTVANDLTIVEGTLKRDNNSDKLDVNRNVSIESGGKLNHTGGAESGEDEFGSLTIASGGTYTATSGTTTITDTTGGGYSWNNAGTFTHNNGKVTFTDNLNPYIIESTFYDMEINLGQNTSELRSDDIGGAGFTILNDLTITRGRFKFNTAGDSMTVHGLTKLETNGQFGLNSPSGTHTFNGLVTVNGGTWNLSSGTNNMAGIRNVGGTIS